MSTVLKTRKIQRQKKDTLALEATIVTAADSKYFTALQYLICSVRKWHGLKQKIICINLGLSIPQKVWLRKNKVLIYSAPRPKIIPTTIEYWQTWNKPQYLIKVFKVSSCKKLIWLDADCILLDRIDFIDRQINLQLAVFADTGAIKYWGFEEGNEKMRNKVDWFRPSTFFPNEYPNAGVIGISSKDKLLQKWHQRIKHAANTKHLFNRLSFYDQGALQLVLEETGNTNLVIQDERYNYAAIEVLDVETKYDFHNYLLGLKNRGIKIAHLLRKAPYEKIKFEAEIINTLKRRFYNPENGDLVTQSIRRSPLGIS